MQAGAADQEQAALKFTYSKASAVKSACDDSTCPRSVDGDLQSGRTLAIVSNVTFGAAGVGVAIGIVGLVLAGRK